MPRKRNKQSEGFTRSLLMNTWTYKTYEDMLVEIALSRFEWKNLPDSCDERYLERALLYNGQAVYCKDEVMGDLTLKVTLGGRIGVYGIPVNYQGYGDNGYTIKLNPTNSVLIFNDYQRHPTYPVLSEFAMRLYDLDRTIDTNVQAQKTPVLITCDENERLSMENLYDMYQGNRPVIFGKKGLRVEDFAVLKTDAPYVSDKIYDLKTQYFNEALTYLGISNVSFEKNERLISDEVSRSMGGTIANRMAFLSMRKKAVEQINKMFGTNIEVDMRDEFDEGFAPEEDGENVLETDMKMSSLARGQNIKG